MNKFFEIAIILSVQALVLFAVKVVHGQDFNYGYNIFEYFNQSHDRDWLMNSIKEDIIKDVLANSSKPIEGTVKIAEDNMNRFVKLMEYCNYYVSYGNMSFDESCGNLVSRFNNHMEQLFLSSKTDIDKIRGYHGFNP